MMLSKMYALFAISLSCLSLNIFVRPVMLTCDDMMLLMPCAISLESQVQFVAVLEMCVVG